MQKINKSQTNQGLEKMYFLFKLKNLILKNVENCYDLRISADN